jgi:hypothetical protein
LAEKAWCAAVAMPMTSTASHRLSIDWAKKTGVTAKAQASMVSLRARLAV